MQDGILRINDIAAFAGNITKLITPPIGIRWRLISLRIQIVCDGTVANRYMRVYQLGTVTSHATGIDLQAAAATAGQTKVFAITPNYALTNVTQVADFAAGLSNPILLENIVSLLVGVSGGVAGDSVSASYLIEEYSN